LSKLIVGKFILNQQNGINPPGETCNQSAWHRDLPYQHYVSSTPLTINALLCMVYHAGGFNRTNTERRAVNHVYTIPCFKQQIKLPELLSHIDLNSELKELFGFNYQEPKSIDQYLNSRL